MHLIKELSAELEQAVVRIKSLDGVGSASSVDADALARDLVRLYWSMSIDLRERQDDCDIVFHVVSEDFAQLLRPEALRLEDALCNFKHGGGKSAILEMVAFLIRMQRFEDVRDILADLLGEAPADKDFHDALALLGEASSAKPALMQSLAPHFPMGMRKEFGQDVLDSFHSLCFLPEKGLLFASGFFEGKIAVFTDEGEFVHYMPRVFKQPAGMFPDRDKEMLWVCEWKAGKLDLCAPEGDVVNEIVLGDILRDSRETCIHPYQGALADGRLYVLASDKDRKNSKLYIIDRDNPSATPSSLTLPISRCSEGFGVHGDSLFIVNANPGKVYTRHIDDETWKLLYEASSDECLGGLCMVDEGFFVTGSVGLLKADWDGKIVYRYDIVKNSMFSDNGSFTIGVACGGGTSGRLFVSDYYRKKIYSFGV